MDYKTLIEKKKIYHEQWLKQQEKYQESLQKEIKKVQHVAQPVKKEEPKVEEPVAPVIEVKEELDINENIEVLPTEEPEMEKPVAKKKNRKPENREYMVVEDPENFNE